MKTSAIGSKRKPFHRLGAAVIALAAASTIALITAPTAGAASWYGNGGTGSLSVNNFDCLGTGGQHTGPCEGALVHWHVRLSITGFSAEYENEACVSAPSARTVDQGYADYGRPGAFDWKEKYISPGAIEDYLDNPCANQ